MCCVCNSAGKKPGNELTYLQHSDSQQYLGRQLRCQPALPKLVDRCPPSKSKYNLFTILLSRQKFFSPSLSVLSTFIRPNTPQHATALKIKCPPSIPYFHSRLIFCELYSQNCIVVLLPPSLIQLAQDHLNQRSCSKSSRLLQNCDQVLQGSATLVYQTLSYFVQLCFAILICIASIIIVMLCHFDMLCINYHTYANIR